jgi:hypothetical protein
VSHTDYSGDDPLLEDGYDDAGAWTYEEPRKSRARSCLPVLLVLVVLGTAVILGGRWAYGELSTRLASAPDYDGPGSGEVVYQVQKGATSAEIGRDLKEAGVVASVDAFNEAARRNEASRSIQVGYYQLQEKMKASEALDVLVDPAKAGEVEAAEAFSDRLVHRALRYAGTSTGEHGVGLHKMQYLTDEHGPHTVALMRAVKQAFDPRNIFNPGKVVSFQSQV